MSDRQELNRNLAQMLKGGVIMDVTPADVRPLAQHHRLHLASGAQRYGIAAKNGIMSP